MSNTISPRRQTSTCFLDLRYFLECKNNTVKTADCIWQKREDQAAQNFNFLKDIFFKIFLCRVIFDTLKQKTVDNVAHIVL